MFREYLAQITAALALLGASAWVASREVEAPLVEGTPVRRADTVATVLLSGRVLPPAEVELMARVSAPVIELLHDEGDAVELGAVLARVDATEAEAEVALARAALERAEAARERIASPVAEEQLTSARLRVAATQRTLEQTTLLVASGAWPEGRLAAARDAAFEAQSAERGASLVLAAERDADPGAAVDEANAALTLAEERCAESVVRAPVAGVIIDRRVAVGDAVGPGIVLFRLAADGPPILSVEPDEHHLAELAVGQSASAASDAHADRPFAAHVTFIAPAVDPERGTVEVRLRPTESVDFLHPDMTVSVEIEVGRVAGALVVPTRLVHDSASDAPSVWVEEGGWLRRRLITLGLRGDDDVQVLDGLAEGERALEIGDRRLAAGDRIRVLD